MCEIPWLHIKFRNKNLEHFITIHEWNPLLYQSLHNNILFSLSLRVQFQSSSHTYFSINQIDERSNVPCSGLYRTSSDLRQLYPQFSSLTELAQNPNTIQIVWNLLGFNLCYSWNPSPAPYMHWPSSKHCRKMVNGEALLHPIPFITTENWQNPSIWKKFQESNQQF